MRLLAPKKKKTDAPFTICICLGGFSPLTKVCAVIGQLDSLDAECLHIVVIESFDTIFDRSIDSFKIAKKDVTFEFKKNIDQVIQANCHIDLFLIGGGFLKFEILHLGEPFLIYPIIDHQKNLVETFEHMVGVDLEFDKVMANVKTLRELKSLLYHRKKDLSRFKHFFSRDDFFSQLGF